MTIQLHMMGDRPPVLDLLEEENTKNLRRLRNGLDRLAGWAEMDYATRCKTDAAMRGILNALLAGLENHRKLPSTTACICPSCQTVILPVAAPSTYEHCGRLWSHDGRAGFTALPADFWQTHMPGDAYKGEIQAAWAKEERR
jgi:hypothetical protein